MEFKMRLRPNDHIVYREEDDGAFLFDPETGNLKYMNRSAKIIYLMLSDQNDTDRIIQNLQSSYPDTGKNQIRKDLETFIQQLEKNGFISSHAA